MSLERSTPSRLLQRLRANRNTLLFALLMLLILLLPLYRHETMGEIAFGTVNLLIIAGSALSNGAWRRLFWISLALALPAIGLGVFAIALQADRLQPSIWLFAAAVHMVSIVRLLDEIFRASRITRDHLFACANAYMLIGVAWCYMYALLDFVVPGSLTGLGPRLSLHAADTIYFSFNIVTSVALTDVLPGNDFGKALVLVQELVSVLFMAFVISRLVGQYAPVPTPASARTNGSAPPIA